MAAVGLRLRWRQSRRLNHATLCVSNFASTQSARWKMSTSSLNHNISAHIGQHFRTRGKTRINVEIFKTLLQALTSIQYELFMVCSTLGSLSLSLLFFVTLTFPTFSRFKLEQIFFSGGTGHGCCGGCDLATHMRHAESTLPVISSPAGSHLRPP